ncbi:hypothetical protein PHYBLDRAFT_161600 [Phycomyces blakesleeanus NRRL 1555(-)]|uniref:Uncharacterized protein n=1 Tax=Phycomyces blakesleeanus (strain ATCC 8743b / DSM 1359 / FGSC 10004 / NBRC 33097 / NRRL 1555) TaxID=763407 RepID=A0A162V8Z8_PHYB8|nr:hypothetical protein PHYBLDRAFT_161600 [Phycomyces blakesleeanus NRRL 1555(-)]OAD80963.1 hypothetical protein PHYBLDRAFT_161600 [Phycomyces blakesleeanus NRRL 1555(-)]|eukprot:XP_018299003.1 hypothetical protein PHYBLDRAFT_161600 [Phycomyces blakesleeanus NRRL 1555(-)]
MPLASLLGTTKPSFSFVSSPSSGRGSLNDPSSMTMDSPNGNNSVPSVSAAAAVAAAMARQRATTPQTPSSVPTKQRLLAHPSHLQPESRPPNFPGMPMARPVKGKTRASLGPEMTNDAAYSVMRHAVVVGGGGGGGGTNGGNSNGNGGGGVPYPNDQRLPPLTRHTQPLSRQQQAPLNQAQPHKNKYGFLVSGGPGVIMNEADGPEYWFSADSIANYEPHGYEPHYEPPNYEPPNYEQTFEEDQFEASTSYETIGSYENTPSYDSVGHYETIASHEGADNRRRVAWKSWRQILARIAHGRSAAFPGSFTDHRSIFTDKMAALRQEIQQVMSKNGLAGWAGLQKKGKKRGHFKFIIYILDTHAGLLESVSQQETNKRKMIDDSGLFWEYQRQQTDNQAALMIYQAEEDYHTETQNVRERLFAALEAKRRKLKEEKDNGDFTFDVPIDAQIRPQKRNLRKRGNETTEIFHNYILNPFSLLRPSLVFRLTEDDMSSDMIKMRGGIEFPVKKACAAVHKKK